MKGRKKLGLTIFLGTIIFIVVMYLIVAFTNVPILSDMRNIWIETAMTTADHQWLATKLFPKSVIDKVMSNKIEDSGEVGITEIKMQKTLTESSGVVYDFSDMNENIEKLVNEKEKVEVKEEVKETSKEEGIFSDTDKYGNKVIVNDKEQGIKIVEVKTVSYTAKLVFIDDPSRVFVADTDTKGTRGKLILNYLKNS